MTRVKIPKLFEDEILCLLHLPNNFVPCQGVGLRRHHVHDVFTQCNHDGSWRCNGLLNIFFASPCGCPIRYTSGCLRMVLTVWQAKDMIKFTHDRLFIAFLGCAVVCHLEQGAERQSSALVDEFVMFVYIIWGLLGTSRKDFFSCFRFRADCCGLQCLAPSQKFNKVSPEISHETFLYDLGTDKEENILYILRLSFAKKTFIRS